MDAVLIAVLFLVFLIAWLKIRERVEELERQVGMLKDQAPDLPRSLPPLPPPQPVATPVEQGLDLPSPAPAPRPHTDWEATLGGNWLNKVGVFVLVIGIALLLGYSFTRVGPAGRVGISLAASFAMLTAGVVLEPRERYRIFGRGLLGGGWAALYFTVYAMHAIEAARVIESPWAGALLLLAVAIGMIAHSLRYRSPTVTGLAYFIAFITLAITQINTLSVMALVPLAASLLYISHRFAWSKMALFGLIATYVTCALRGDTGAPLWQAQTIFAVYWLLFEAFDILADDPWFLPLNFVGFFSLSLARWLHSAPGDVWQLLAATAAVYLAGAIIRARSDRWHGPATIAAALAAVAIFLKLDRQWVAFALLVEAELYYLAGVQLRKPYLRYLAGAIFGLEVCRLLADVGALPARTWEPVAALGVLVFYANRAVFSGATLYGYAAAGLAALIAGFEAPVLARGRTWTLLAIVPFLAGWWRRLPDFRFQGYLLLALGALATSAETPYPPLQLAIVAAVNYAGVWCAWRSAGDRFFDWEREPVGVAGSVAANLALVALIWRQLAPVGVGPAWALFAVALLCAGLWGKQPALCWQSYAVALGVFARCWYANLAGDLEPVPACAVAIACLYAAQLLSPRGGGRLWYSVLATALTTILLCYEVSGRVLTVACGVQGAALLAAGFPLRDRVLRLSGLALLLGCILKLFVYDLSYLETLPRIFSFLVLGVILVGVSWVYTRFRERIARYL